MSAKGPLHVLLPLRSLPKTAVCRCLFGPADHEEIRRTTKLLSEFFTSRAASDWNFDFIRDVPLGGRYFWKKVLLDAETATFMKDEREGDENLNRSNNSENFQPSVRQISTISEKRTTKTVKVLTNSGRIRKRKFRCDVAAIRESGVTALTRCNRGKDFNTISANNRYIDCEVKTSLAHNTSVNLSSRHFDHLENGRALPQDKDYSCNKTTTDTATIQCQPITNNLNSKTGENATSLLNNSMSDLTRVSNSFEPSRLPVLNNPVLSSEELLGVALDTSKVSRRQEEVGTKASPSPKRSCKKMLNDSSTAAGSHQGVITDYLKKRKFYA